METVGTKNCFQRFQRILGRGLAIGLESNIAKGELAKHQLNGDYNIVYGPQADYVRHSAVNNRMNLLKKLLLNPNSAKPLQIVFKDLPSEVSVLFQRLNIRQRADDQVLGLAFARFPVPEIAEEKEVFYAIKENNQTDGYLNLDCLSRSPKWNPLFVKYHLSVMPSLKANEFGYVRIEIHKGLVRPNIPIIFVKIFRVPESEVPDILKSAKTLPR